MDCFLYNFLEGESENKAEVVQKTRKMETISPCRLNLFERDIFNSVQTW